jgi:hypothetical protein
MEFVKTLIKEHPFQILLYAICITVFLFFQLIDKRKKRTQYKVWKRESINLGFYKREYERSEDAFIQQLWDENDKLRNENKFLKKENSKIGIIAALFLLAYLLVSKLRKR